MIQPELFTQFQFAAKATAMRIRMWLRCERHLAVSQFRRAEMKLNMASIGLGLGCLLR